MFGLWTERRLPGSYHFAEQVLCWRSQSRWSIVLCDFVGCFLCVKYELMQPYRKHQRKFSSKKRRRKMFALLRLSCVYFKLFTLRDDGEDRFNGICILLEWFSNDWRKTKTKAIIPTNHNRNKQHYEPITIPSNYLQLARSAGKVTRTWCDLFWFYLSLVEKLARVFLANH